MYPGKNKADGLQPAEGILIIVTEGQTAKPTEKQEKSMKKWYDEEYEFNIEVTGFLHGDHMESVICYGI